MEYPVPAEEYAEELNNLFDIWSKDKESIPVSPLMYYIEDVLGVYVTRECNNGKCLGKFIDVDSKGMIRICSHSSDSNYLLGHINDFDSIEELFNSDRFNSLVYAMIEKNKNCLQGCEFYNYCMGGCCVSRLNNSDYMCKVNKIVYPYIKKSVQLIIEQESLNEYNDTICHAIVKAFSVNPELFVL